jgi:hypothetical protein
MICVAGTGFDTNNRMQDKLDEVSGSLVSLIFHYLPFASQVLSVIKTIFSLV